jgi:hypothetical protein
MLGFVPHPNLRARLRPPPVSGTLTQNTWFAPGSTVIEGDLIVPAGITLTLQAGAQLRFAGNDRIAVEGTLRVLGSAASPVVFTSDQRSRRRATGRASRSAPARPMCRSTTRASNTPTGGVYFGPGSTGTVSNSTLRFNRYGIYAYGDRTAANNPLPVVSGNSLYANTDYDYYSYYFAETETTILDATGNWWGGLYS